MITEEFTAIPKEIVFNKDISSASKMVLITMLAYPDISRFTKSMLMEYINESRSYVDKALNELTKCKILRIYNHSGKTEYALNLNERGECFGTEI